MASAYSLDLRLRILQAYDHGKSVTAVAEGDIVVMDNLSLHKTAGVKKQ